MKTVALIVAGGKGLRFGGSVPKQFRNIHNRPLLAWTIAQFEEAEKIDDIVLVVPEEYLLFAHEKVSESFDFAKLSRIVTGGKTRQESVARGLEPISTSFVAIHDGARPVISPDDINRVVDAAQKERAAILARPISDTVKRVEGGYIIATLDREKLFMAETPQVFQYDLIFSAHKEYAQIQPATDDACLVEARGFKVRTIVPTKPNIKVTDERDLSLAAFLLKDRDETIN